MCVYMYIFLEVDEIRHCGRSKKKNEYEGVCLVFYIDPLLISISFVTTAPCSAASVFFCISSITTTKYIIYINFFLLLLLVQSRETTHKVCRGKYNKIFSSPQFFLYSNVLSFCVVFRIVHSILNDKEMIISVILNNILTIFFSTNKVGIAKNFPII